MTDNPSGNGIPTGRNNTFYSSGRKSCPHDYLSALSFVEQGCKSFGEW
jgi:hypothetical protein